MLPLHTSGIVACTYHLFYNAPAIGWCVALQAGMTCLGNTTLALACLRLALASGWTWQMGKEDAVAWLASMTRVLKEARAGDCAGEGDDPASGDPAPPASATPVVSMPGTLASEAGALLGWEDLGDAWATDSDAFFLVKLAALSSGLAYVVKYAPALLPGAVVDAWAALPDSALSAAALAVIVVPTGLNCAKWAQRSKEDADFVGDF